MAVQSVTLFVNSANHVAKCWKDYVASYVRPSYQIKGADGFESDLANKIFEKLGYRFKYPLLLRSAFTHPSYPVAWARVPCYQRLEFLGDALLDMVCVEDLFDRFPDKDPQWLTEHKVRLAKWSLFQAADRDIDGNGLKQISWCSCGRAGLSQTSSTLQFSCSVKHYSICRRYSSGQGRRGRGNGLLAWNERITKGE